MDHSAQHQHQSQPQAQDVLAEARKNLQVLIDSGLSRDMLHQLVDENQVLQLALPTQSSLLQQQQQQQQSQQQSQQASQHQHIPPMPQCPPPPPPNAAAAAHPQQQSSHQHQHQHQQRQQQPILSPIATTTTTSSTPAPAELKADDVHTGIGMLENGPFKGGRSWSLWHPPGPRPLRRSSCSSLLQR